MTPRFYKQLVGAQLAMGAVLMGCSQPAPVEGGYACTTDAECPARWVCRADRRCWSTALSSDAGPSDAPGSDAPGVDAFVADAPGLDAPGLDALSVDAPGLDAPSVDAPRPPAVLTFLVTRIAFAVPASGDSVGIDLDGMLGGTPESCGMSDFGYRGSLAIDNQLGVLPGFAEGANAQLSEAMYRESGPFYVLEISGIDSLMDDDRVMVSARIVSGSPVFDGMGPDRRFRPGQALSLGSRVTVNGAIVAGRLRSAMPFLGGAASFPLGAEAYTPVGMPTLDVAISADGFEGALGGTITVSALVLLAPGGASVEPVLRAFADAERDATMVCRALSFGANIEAVPVVVSP